jgi:hypothetical protein
MTSPTTLDPNEELGDQPTPPARHRRELSTSLLVVIAVASLVVMALVLVIVVNTGTHSQDQATSIAKDTAPAVNTLDQLCKRGDQLAADLTALGQCGSSLSAAKSAVAGAPTTEAPAPGGGLTQADVIQVVKTQIAGYVVTPAQVSALVAQVYNANKPAAGKDAPPVTSDQVLAAVSTVCANDRCRGPAGASATDPQVASAVASYCGTTVGTGPCAGPQGEPGPTGSTGPSGPQGIPGPPGFTCDQGYHFGTVNDVGVPPQDIEACVPDTTAATPTSN